MAQIIDCTMVVSNKMWRGIWRVSFGVREWDLVEVEGTRMKKIETDMHMNVHTATHIDSPLHFIEGGPTIDEIPIDRCFGEAAVVDLTSKRERDQITATDMEERGKHVKEGDIVLLKTGWTERNAGGNTEKMEGLPLDWNYWKNGPYPTKSMAEWMVNKKVKAVGFDSPNESQHTGPHIVYEMTRTEKLTEMHECPVHRIHLSHGILQIEYLCNLTAIKKDRVKFFAVPLKLKAEASPVRAFVIEE